MAKQTFTTGQVLTAAQMTSLQQTAMGGGAATAKTASYVLTAADAGTVVQMNAAGATTITVNTALFAAGDSVQIQNIGAGICTITAGTATVTTAGSLALSQWEGGNLYFTSTSASIFFDIVQSSGMTNPMTTTGDTIYSSSGSTPARLGIGSTGQVLTVAAGIPSWATPASGSTFSGASVYFSSTLTLTANTEVVIGFNNENYDTNTYHDNSTNNSRLTVPSTGYYLVSGYYISNQTGNRRMVYIKKNGTTLTQYTAFAGTGITECTSVAEGVYYATAGDYFQLVAYSENTTPATAQAGSIYNNFSIAYLGA